jgi:hypothetical protein
LKAVVIIPYDIEVCKTYARLKNDLKTPSGSDRVIGANDLWIAACAVRHGLPLISNNRKHFDGIPGLALICEAPALREIASQENRPLAAVTIPPSAAADPTKAAPGKPTAPLPTDQK